MHDVENGVVVVVAAAVLVVVKKVYKRKPGSIFVAVLFSFVAAMAS